MSLDQQKITQQMVDLSERVRSTARIGLPALAAVLAGIGVIYMVSPPLEPGWLYATLSFLTSAIFVLVWVAIRRVAAPLVTPLLIVACLAAVAFSLGFVGFTGDADQTTTLLLTLLAAGCLLIDVRAIVAVVLAGTLGWIALLPLQDPAPAAHWSIDLVATALIAIVVTVVRRRLFFELEALNRHNRLLVDSAGEAIYGIDALGRITFVNPVAERVLGRSGADLVGKEEHPLLHLEPTGQHIYPETSCPFCHLGPDSERIPLPLLRPSGESGWVEITRTPVPPPDALHTVVTMRDVTEQTWVQRALKESEERNRLIIETSLDGVVSIDPAGRIVGWNPQAEQIFGWSRAEALGRTVVETLLPHSMRTAFEAEWEAFQETGESRVFDRRIESRALRRDGLEFPVELSVARTGADGRRHYTAFVRDITKRIEAAERLHEARDAAETAAKVKSDFLATMSHEIRTPLNGVFGMTELALDTRDNEERRDFLLRARSCAQSLMKILNEVLDFSKIESGHLPIDCVEFDPEQLLDGVIDTVAAEAQRKHLELIGRVEASVPHRLLGDPDRLRQVLLNLAGNAIKFTERGEVILQLSARESDRPGWVSFEGRVRDTGIGIPDGQQSQIFNPFTQADSSTTRVFGGTGLGLAIAQRLVALMEGEITVESTPGAGSLFSFSVALEVAGQPGRLSPVLPAGLRVLVVDDNAASRDALTATLRDWGCRADATADGTLVSRLLQEAASEGADYGLVLLDLEMPDPDGLKTARWIRASGREADTPIVALTPLASSFAAELGELGVRDCLNKPIKQKTLRVVLESVLRRDRKPKLRPIRLLPRTAEGS